MNDSEIEIKQSHIGQFDDGLGVFAKRDFKKGEVVLQWNLQILSEAEYTHLNLYEKQNFCHRRDGIIYLYPDPERHVNRAHNPNVVPDFKKTANIAIRDIRKGEELSIPIDIQEDF